MPKYYYYYKMYKLFSYVSNMTYRQIDCKIISIQKFKFKSAQYYVFFIRQI